MYKLRRLWNLKVSEETFGVREVPEEKKQLRMFITMCGRAQKVNKYGEAYGWSCTVFTTVEDFWEKRGVILPGLDSKASYEKIREQIMRLNPEAEQKKIEKFIRG